MADEPDLYLQVIGFEGLHGVREPGRKVKHFTWNPDISFDPDYLALDPKLRLIIRELIDMQAEGGGVVEYKLKAMRRRWRCKAEIYLAKLIAGGVVRIVDRRGRVATPRGLLATYRGREATLRGPGATPLLEIPKSYNPRIRNKNIRARARGPEGPRSPQEEGHEQRRKNHILETVRDAAAKGNLTYAYLQCRRDDEPGPQPSQEEFAGAWRITVQPELPEDHPAKGWHPTGEPV